LNRSSTGVSVGSLVARLATAGVLLLAGYTKLQGGPTAFALAIESFELVPGRLLLPVAYFLPWFEIVIAAALILGVWARESAALATAMLAAFTLGLASVLVRGLDVDCGCFGGLFGESKVSWASIARNTVFIAIAAVPVWLGGGRFALTRESDSSPGAA